MNLRDITPENLASTKQLVALHGQAVEAGLIGAGEAALLDFVAMAERARAHGKRPAALFAWLLHQGKRGRAFISQADEDRAHARIKRDVYGIDAHASRREDHHHRPPPPGPPSEDVAKYMAVVKATGDGRTALRPQTVAQLHLGWDAERWAQAEAGYWEWMQAKAEAVGGRD